MLMLMSAARQHAAVLLGLTFLLPVSALHTYNTNPSVRLQFTWLQRQKLIAQKGKEKTQSRMEIHAKAHKLNLKHSGCL